MEGANAAVGFGLEVAFRTLANAEVETRESPETSYR